jgi:hypothetical protein
VAAGAAAAAVCDGWGATGTAGDIAGAYAYGTACLITSGDVMAGGAHPVCVS